MANIFNVEIFHRNLELLHSMTGLSKGDFANLLEVRNAFRNDIRAIGPKMKMGITNNFHGVDESWLLSEHPEGLQGIKFTPRKKDAHGSSQDKRYTQPTPVYPPASINDRFHAEVADVIHDVTDIMFSGKTDIIDALKKNVKEFRRAVDTENELKECRIMMDGMQKQIDTLNAKVDRLTAPPIGADHDAG